jgi:hypothetical protein
VAASLDTGPPVRIIGRNNFDLYGAPPDDIDIPQAKLNRIRAKLADMQWPEAPADDGDWRYGVDLKSLRELVEYWVTGYEWHTAESELNRYPHFKTMVDDTDIHFVLR